MFEAFYKLSTNPFRLTPDPKFCFRHPSYDQAYAYLQYALRLGEGFILVTGRPGIGKTTLAEVFLTEIENSEVVAARIASANVEAADLLRVVAYSYGIDVLDLDKATVLMRLEQFFIQETRSGKRVLLIIDEAQGLPHSALEELRLLADLQMDSHPLVQLFLVGQEKLRGLMREPDMEQFQQRVIGACHLEPLDLTATRSYMEHRLRTAGWKGDPQLSGAAVLALYQYSKGVPRHVNKICTRLLLHGMLEEKHELHKEDVLSVEQELRAEQLAPMERDETVPTDAAKAAGVPELAGGSLSIPDLALRVDPQEAEQQQAGDHPATAAVSDVANQVDATPSARAPELAAASNERSTAQIPPQEPGWGPATPDRPGLRYQYNRQSLTGVGEFPAQLRRRPRQARAAVSPRQATPQVKSRTARREKAGKGVKTLLARPGTWRSVMSAPSITLSQYAGETARMFGRLQWKGKLVVLVGGLLAVNLITAVLMTQFMDDGGDRQSLLAGYPEPMPKDVSKDQPQALTAAAQGQKNSALDSGETDRRQAGRDDAIASTQTAASPRQQADEGQDDRLASIADSSDRERVIAGSRGRLPDPTVSVSRPTDSSVQETGLTVAEPDRATVESVAASGTKQTNNQLKVRQRIDEDPGSGMSASVESPPQSGPVPSQDKSSPSEGAQIAEPLDAAERSIPATAPEVLAKATPPVADEHRPPTPAEEKAVPAPVSRREKIAQLLALGEQSLKRDRLLIPTHDSAYKYYQQTLIMDPGNDEALFGIERIVARYIVLARKALERQDKIKSRRYIDRGLSINPTDRRLLALRDSLNTPVAVIEPQVQPAVVQAEQQTPAAEPTPQRENFFSRMKAFFTRGQSATKQNEVVVEERR